MNDQFILTPYFLDNPMPGLEVLSETDWKINVGELPNSEPQARMTVLHEQLAAMVLEVVQSGSRPVSIAGDCCTAIGVAAGLQRAGVKHTLLWFDAHGDFNTWETSPSGFLGGMPLAMLVGRGEQTMPSSVGLRSLCEKRVILTDARHPDSGEKEELERSGLTWLREVSDLIDYPLPDTPLYVHFDTDIVDPVYAPAMNYPAPGGPSPDRLQRVFRRLAETGRIIAVSMSSWNPKPDSHGKTKDECMKLLQALLGR